LPSIREGDALLMPEGKIFFLYVTSLNGKGFREIFQSKDLRILLKSKEKWLIREASYNKNGWFPLGTN